MLSTLVVAGAFLRSVNGAAMDLDDAPPTVEPTWEPTVEPEGEVVSTGDQMIALAEGYVYGTPDHDSCPTDYIAISDEQQCRNAAMIMSKGWVGARGIGVCTYITNSRHVNDNDKFFYGPIGATENNEADHHTLVCKRAECGEIERNYNYVGGDTGMDAVPSVNSAEDCARICASEPLCHSFTYGKKAGHPMFQICQLKSELKHTTRTLDDCCDSGLPCAEDATAAPQCVSLPPEWMDKDGDGCQAYGEGDGWCGAGWQQFYRGNGGFTADEACCECGGGRDAAVDEATATAITLARRRAEATTTAARRLVAGSAKPRRRAMKPVTGAR